MVTVTHENGTNMIRLVQPTREEQLAACQVAGILNPDLIQSGEIAIDDEELAEGVAQTIRLKATALIGMNELT